MRATIRLPCTNGTANDLARPSEGLRARIAAVARQEQLDYFAVVRRGVFCELGHGAVDFPRLMEGLKRDRYEGWAVVEQDVLPALGTPLASATRNRAYLRGLGL